MIIYSTLKHPDEVKSFGIVFEVLGVEWGVLGLPAKSPSVKKVAQMLGRLLLDNGAFKFRRPAPIDRLIEVAEFYGHELVEAIALPDVHPLAPLDLEGVWRRQVEAYDWARAHAKEWADRLMPVVHGRTPEEYGLMAKKVAAKFPHAQIVAVGGLKKFEDPELGRRAIAEVKRRVGPERVHAFGARLYMLCGNTDIRSIDTIILVYYTTKKGGYAGLLTSQQTNTRKLAVPRVFEWVKKAVYSPCVKKSTPT